jgi:hypothetical protein
MYVLYIVSFDPSRKEARFSFYHYDYKDYQIYIAN